MPNDWGSFIADTPAGCIDRENRALRVNIVAGGGGGSSTLKCDELSPDGSTQTFTLADTPNGAVILVWNGITMKPSSSFSVSGNALTTIFTAKNGDDLFAYYIPS